MAFSDMNLPMVINHSTIHIGNWTIWKYFLPEWPRKQWRRCTEWETMLRRIVHWLGGGCSPWTRDPGTASGTDASPGHVCPLWTGSLSCYQPWRPAPARMTKKQLMVAWIFLVWSYDIMMLLLDKSSKFKDMKSEIIDNSSRGRFVQNKKDNKFLNF